MSNLLSSCEFTENVLRYGNEAEIMLVKPPIVNRLQNLNNHESQCEPEDNQVRTCSRGELCFENSLVNVYMLCFRTTLDFSQNLA